MFHSRTKDIQLRYHFIQSLLENGELTLKKVLGSKNPVDMLTKMVVMDKLKLWATSFGCPSLLDDDAEEIMNYFMLSLWCFLFYLYVYALSPSGRLMSVEKGVLSRHGVCLLFEHGVLSHIGPKKGGPLLVYKRRGASKRGMTCNPFLMRDVVGKDFCLCTCMNY